MFVEILQRYTCSRNDKAIVNFVENNRTDSFNFEVKMTVKLEMMEQKLLK